MENLFAYGTLMCDDIMRDVSGSSLSHVPGILKGYSRRSVRREHYPGLIPDLEGRIEGVVYRHVPDSAWDRLDQFEGEMYARRLVEIELSDGMPLLAATYVFRPEYVHRLEQYDWDFTDFLRNGKVGFQRHYQGYQSLCPSNQHNVSPDCRRNSVLGEAFVSMIKH